MDYLRDSRTGRIEAAGFNIIEANYRSSDIPTEAAAWRRIVSSLVIPEYTVPHESDHRKRDLEANWRRAAIDCGAVSEDGQTLLSLAKVGSDERGWALVSIPQVPVDLEQLGPYLHHPEFVIMSIAGNVLCGVTSEEDAMWIIVAKCEPV